MKRTASLLALLLLIFQWGFSQILEPVEWSTSVEKISDDTYILVSKTNIEKGWHLYAQDVPEDGPIPTTFSYNLDEEVVLLGLTKELEGHIVDDPVFLMKIKYFEEYAEFRQAIKVSNNRLSSVLGEVEFMVCDDTRCLPPSYVDLEFNLNEAILIDAKVDALDENLSTNVSVKKQNDKKGLWSIFIIAFLSGFAALLTPCVFPMIPMTVSFFTKQSKSKALGIRNAIIYGISIVIIYVLLGSMVTAIFGADVLNALATNVWFNVVFFVLLLVFAFSFLGAFEIVLPNSWANKVDRPPRLK